MTYSNIFEKILFFLKYVMSFNFWLLQNKPLEIDWQISIEIEGAMDEIGLYKSL